MRRGILQAVALGAVALGAGCAEEEGPDRAWLLIDQQAREAGVGVVVEGEERSAALPLEVDAGVEVVILDVDDAPTSLWTEPGAVHHVMGAQADVWTGFVDWDVAADAIEVYGDEEAAWRLADAVGGDLELEGDAPLLVAHGLYEELAALDVDPRDDLDLWPVEQDGSPLEGVGQALVRQATTGAVGELGSRVVGAFAGAAPKIGRGARTGDELDRQDRLDLEDLDLALARAGVPSRSPAELVGWYCSGDECLVLGIDFSARECLADQCATATWSLTEAGVQVGPRTYRFAGAGFDAGGRHLANALEVTRGR